MRALRFIVWLLVSRALVFGQLAVNTNAPGVYPYPQPLPNTVTAPAASQLITGPAARSAYSDKGPAVWDVWVGGGYQPAATIADRNAIQLQRRKEGMLCWVKADNHLYRVGSDISNAGWVDLGILNGSATLYTVDGSIAGNRAVDLGFNNLSFTGGGNVGVGVSPGSATGGKLDVSGTLNLRPSLIGNFPSSGSISVGFVNANSAIMINQTTPGVVLSIAPPTPSVAGRILTVINVGSESLAVSGVPVRPATGVSFVWSGSAWIQTSGPMGSIYETDGVFSGNRTATIPTATTLTFSGPGSAAISPAVSATLSSASSTIIGSSLMKFITPSVSAGTSAVGQVLTLSSTNGTVDFQAIPAQSTLYTADGTIPSLRTINNVGGMTISGSGAFTFVSGTQARFGTSGNFITATPAGGISAVNSNFMNFESNDLTLTGISSLRIRTTRVNDTVALAGETLISQDTNGLAEWAMKGYVPTGGTTGQILTKISGTDYAASWQSFTASTNLYNTSASITASRDVTVPTSMLLTVTGAGGFQTTNIAAVSIGSTNTVLRGNTSLRIATPNVVTATATAGQFLRLSDTVGTSEFSSDGIVPVGGTTGQVLAKTSGTDHAVGWSTPLVGANTNLSNLGTTSVTQPLNMNNNIVMVPLVTANRNINFGTGFNNPAIILYDGGATIRYGWGLRSGNMQFYAPTIAMFSWNKGGDFQSVGVNELMRLDGTTGRLGVRITAPLATVHSVAESTSFPAGRFQSSTTITGSATAPALDVVDSSAAQIFAVYHSGEIRRHKVITAPGTTSTQTINTALGMVNAPAGATSLTVNNSIVTTSSFVDAGIASNDATAAIKNVVATTGVITINFSAAPTAETKIWFEVK